MRIMFLKDQYRWAHAIAFTNKPLVWNWCDKPCLSDRLRSSSEISCCVLSITPLTISGEILMFKRRVWLTFTSMLSGNELLELPSDSCIRKSWEFCHFSLIATVRARKKERRKHQLIYLIWWRVRPKSSKDAKSSIQMWWNCYVTHRAVTQMSFLMQLAFNFVWLSNVPMHLINSIQGWCF